jgi:hypothetical protein
MPIYVLHSSANTSRGTRNEAEEGGAVLTQYKLMKEMPAGCDYKRIILLDYARCKAARFWLPGPAERGAALARGYNKIVQRYHSQSAAT